MKVLLFGKNGQVGWELQRALAPLGEVIAPARADTSPVRGDLSDPEQVEESVVQLAPDVIINAAAYTAVDKAESAPALARAVNATGPGALGRAAARCNALLVHYSTDYVFDGSGTAAWKEEDSTGPRNVYGLTKLEGERLVRASGCRHLILRTSWVFSASGNNFARTMLRLATERSELTVVDDQYGAPTGAELIADCTVHAVRATLRRPELTGTYHVAASGETTWFEYARHVIDGARAAGWPIRVPADRVRPVTSADFATAARRPSNSRLDTAKAQRAFDLRFPHWTHGVDRMLSELCGSHDPSKGPGAQ